MKYSKVNGIHIVEVPVKDFRIVMNDSKKKTAAKDNYCNAGFFATYHENKQPFTLPIAHLRCDYDATFSATKKYCTERGEFEGKKFTFDSSTWSYMNPTYNNALSTLVINNNQAEIKDIKSVPAECSYAITGIPVMRHKADVKFNSYVKNQGWDGSELRATWHIFIGLKQKQSDTVYIISMKTKTSNMVLSAEAFKAFKDLGFYDVIKLDGGGSAYLKVNNKAVVSTLENRRVNSIILFGPTDTTNNSKDTNGNPYKEPSKILLRGSADKEGIKWLQWQLNALGFNCGDVDGGFGKLTYNAVVLFQRTKGLAVDGKVGPATKAVLKNS